MIGLIFGKFHHLLQKTVEGVLSALVYAAIAVTVTHRVGWLDRWIWFVLEQEGKKAMNGARLTIGGFIIDWSELLQGKITLHASNVVIHTPQRDEWQWDSPLIARVGKATVECNALVTVFHAVFLRREVPIEAYTIIVSDVQVFVERRGSVINVYLLNPTLELPPPPYPEKAGRSSSQETLPGYTGDGSKKKYSANSDEMAWESKSEAQKSSIEPHPDQNNTLSENGEDFSSQSTVNGGTTFFDTKSSINPLEEDEVPILSKHDNHNQQAQVLVNEMLQAVQVLGGAAARGELSGAIKRQGLELVGRLKGFREQENLEEGIRVMQQVGKVAVESFQTAPQLILPKPDTTKEREEKIIYIRIGRIIGNDLRIFTKDSWINATNNQEDFGGPLSGSALGIPNKSNNSPLLQSSTKQNKTVGNKSATTSAAPETNNNKSGSWNKPIFIESMVLRPSELCPPMSMTDDDNLPAIFQSVDKIVEVVWRRLLAEIAKSNTGRLFSTAMGEVLSVMVSNPQHSVPILSSTGPHAAGSFNNKKKSNSKTVIV